MTDEKKRPKPEYGEYAPEGWVSPVTGEPVAPSPSTEPAAPTESVAGQTQLAHTQSTGKSTASSGRLDGVPHNLGVSKATQAQETASETPQHPKPNSVSARMNRPADRIATVMLLAFGAYGALNSASAFMNLQQVFEQIFAVYDLGTFTAPEWFGALSTIGWISQLAVWAITLILSIQLMRRKRMAFYIPLVGAVIAFLITLVLMMIALSAAPELVTYVSEHGFDLKDFQ